MSHMKKLYTFKNGPVFLANPVHTISQWHSETTYLNRLLATDSFKEDVL